MRGIYPLPEEGVNCCPGKWGGYPPVAQRYTEANTEPRQSLSFVPRAAPMAPAHVSVSRYPP